jgi:hypothetical protein
MRQTDAHQRPTLFADTAGPGSPGAAPQPDRATIRRHWPLSRPPAATWPPPTCDATGDVTNPPGCDGTRGEANPL